MAKDEKLPVKRKRGRKPNNENSPLTTRQEAFVKELVSKDGFITLSQAAINAGYPASSAHVRASELTNPKRCPHVVAAIRRYREELNERYNVTFDRHMRDLQRIRDEALANGAYSAAVQAEYRRGQAHGDIYVSKSEIRHGTIDSMSKDEVLKALAELRNQYESGTIDITPDADRAPEAADIRGGLLEEHIEPIEGDEDFIEADKD